MTLTSGLEERKKKIIFHPFIVTRPSHICSFVSLIFLKILLHKYGTKPWNSPLGISSFQKKEILFYYYSPVAVRCDFLVKYGNPSILCEKQNIQTGRIRFIFKNAKLLSPLGQQLMKIFCFLGMVTSLNNGPNVPQLPVTTLLQSLLPHFTKTGLDICMINWKNRSDGISLPRTSYKRHYTSDLFFSLITCSTACLEDSR